MHEAVANCHRTVREGSGFRVVRDHHDGLPGLLVEGPQNIEHGLRVARIEIAGWLIGEQDGRFVHQRASNGDALLLAAGEGAGFV